VKVNGEDTYRAESFVSVYDRTKDSMGWPASSRRLELSRRIGRHFAGQHEHRQFRSLSSNKGYGIYWNNESRSRFNNRFANYLYISSDVADAVDYYFFYGPDLDKVVAAYRTLTGQAPSLESGPTDSGSARIATSRRMKFSEVARKYRELHIPADNIGARLVLVEPEGGVRL